MSNFHFLQSEFPDLYVAALDCERQVLADPRVACFQARRALEVALDWMFDADTALTRPYDGTLAAHLHEPSLKQLMPRRVWSKAMLLKDLGNRAVHDKTAVAPVEGMAAARELFHMLFWVARTYGKAKPADTLQFDAQLLPAPAGQVAAQSLAKLQQTAAELAARDAEVRALKEAQQAGELQGTALKAEVEALQAAVAAAKAEAEATPDVHNYSEAETRDLFIDLLLREAGWLLDQERDREYPVTGMPPDRAKNGMGYVDYVLWGEDGLPLAVVEAKKTREDARIGQEQARLYADCLEKQFGRRPVIFYTNGYEHWLWDDTYYPPRSVAGFLTRGELERTIARREGRQTLHDAPINTAIVERDYQFEAIRAFTGELQNARRRGLLVMATGTGKTRLAIALCELLSRRGWIKNALFLADRQALVKQTENAFKAHWPDAGVVNLLEDKEGEGRVYVSTYPTMMNLIERLKETPAGTVRRFGPGFFDLVIVDEAHRSVYQKYGALFEYFDGLLLGLTATPRGEVARDTYKLFDCVKNQPTFDYTLEEAVTKGYLVPPRPIQVPIKFIREGIQYDDLSEEDKEEWDAKEWNEEGEIPEEVAAPELNAWVFNTDTVDKVLETLMTHGLKVAGGDRLGKTIIFARNRDHALFIRERFDFHYPHLAGHFARVIECKDPFAQSQLDKFSVKDGAPHIAISIDMLDTGVDVPEVLNLVFFKPVRSRTKFFQMLGRGTRLCPNVFGPAADKSDDKREFYVFDFCDNFAYFGQNLPEKPAAAVKSLSKRLFTHRLELLGDTAQAATAETPLKEEFAQLSHEVADTLHAEVAAMNLQNFVVRPHRRQVEIWRERPAWSEYSPEHKDELDEHLAGLPAELPAEDESARQFDLLILRLQLAILRSDKSYQKLSFKVRQTAFLLSSTTARNVPMVAAQMELIEDVASEEWWQDVTVPMLETVRKKLRDLIKFIPLRDRVIVTLDIEDDIDEAIVIEDFIKPPGASTPGTSPTTDYGARLRRVLRDQLNHPVVAKLRRNQPLSPSDVAALDDLVFQAGGFPNRAEFEQYFGAQPSLPAFIRASLGLDEGAVRAAFADFLNDSSFTATQIAFVRQIVDYITQNGGMTAKDLFQQPFTDYNQSSVVGVFPTHAEKLIGLVNTFGPPQ